MGRWATGREVGRGLQAAGLLFSKPLEKPEKPRSRSQSPRPPRPAVGKRVSLGGRGLCQRDWRNTGSWEQGWALPSLVGLVGGLPEGKGSSGLGLWFQPPGLGHPSFTSLPFRIQPTLCGQFYKMDPGVNVQLLS